MVNEKSSAVGVNIQEKATIITHDMLPQHSDLSHACFRSLDSCGKLVKVSGCCRRFLRENGVI